jgi:L-lactate dehydrogenase (cytochrome)
LTLILFSVILKYAGKDATEAYSEVHAASIISKNLAPANLIGILDSSTISSEHSGPSQPPLQKTGRIMKPPLDALINTLDFEEVASKTLSAKAWAYYSSAATDLVTKNANMKTYAKIGLRPRMMKDVSRVSTKTTILGCKTGLPIFVSPAAMARLVHEDGEKAIARACGPQNIIHSISTQASYPVEEIINADDIRPGQTFFFQLYVHRDRRKSQELLHQVQALGVKVLLVTIDGSVPGKREADERVKAEDGLTIPSGGVAKNDTKGGGYGRVMGNFVDASLNWNDVAWLRKCWNGPIVLKGVMTAMDAELAAKYGLDGIIVSNHGGRNLDTAPASILVLLELQRCCPEVFDKLEVLIDGGIRRGTDVFKALCLGAKGVGIGRGFLYALNYGQEGVEKFVASKCPPLACTGLKSVAICLHFLQFFKMSWKRQ